MIGFNFSKYNPAENQQNDFDKLLNLFTQLLTYTSGDFSNSLNKLPSYTTLDLRANWVIKPVTISLSALNLTDKKYSPFGLFSTFKNDYYYFPADGRSFYLSVRYDLK